MLFVPCARSHCDRASLSLQPHGVCRDRSSWVGHPQVRNSSVVHAPSYRVTPSAARRSSSAAMPIDGASCRSSHSISGHHWKTAGCDGTGSVTIDVCLSVYRSRSPLHLRLGFHALQIARQLHEYCAGRTPGSHQFVKCFSIRCLGYPSTFASG